MASLVDHPRLKPHRALLSNFSLSAYLAILFTATVAVILLMIADHEEKVHPGRSEWMAMGMKQDTSDLGDGLSKHVRLLGGGVDMDGGVEKDNVERKKAAR